MIFSYRTVSTLSIGLVLSLGLTACGDSGGGGGTPSPTAQGTTVAVTGTFTGGAHAKSWWLNELWARLIREAYALDPNQVAKVIVFYQNNRFVVASVVNGTFSLQVETGAPVGMIFAGAANNYLGYLTLQNGIDTLPLTKLASGVTAINLGTLSSSGLVVEPGNNPVGNQLPFSSEEQTALLATRLVPCGYTTRTNFPQQLLNTYSPVRTSLSPTSRGCFFLITMCTATTL